MRRGGSSRFKGFFLALIDKRRCWDLTDRWGSKDKYAGGGYCYGRRLSRMFMFRVHFQYRLTLACEQLLFSINHVLKIGAVVGTDVQVI